ncbi:MAG TPA: hypothetical protein VIM59_04935, partial [Cellvibrio sp.]
MEALKNKHFGRKTRHQHSILIAIRVSSINGYWYCNTMKKTMQRHYGILADTITRLSWVRHPYLHFIMHGEIPIGKGKQQPNHTRGRELQITNPEMIHSIAGNKKFDLLECEKRIWTTIM